MTLHGIKSLFANASPDFLARNTGQAPKLERDSRDAPLEKKEVQRRDGPKFFVRVTSVRKRLIDVSNLCYKYHEDLCRYAGILPDDSPQLCHSEVTQRKAEKGEEEKVVINIYELIDKPEPMQDNEK